MCTTLNTHQQQHWSCRVNIPMTNKREKVGELFIDLWGRKKLQCCVIYLAMQMLLSKPFVQNEKFKTRTRRRREWEKRARGEQGHIGSKKGAEVDEERKRHCIEYWIYILYVTDEDQWNQNQQRTRNIIICKFGFLLFLIKTSERRFCLSSFDSFVFCDFHFFFFACFAVSFDIQMMYKTQYKQLRSVGVWGGGDAV